MLQLPRVKVIVHLVWRLYHQDTSTNLVLCRLSIRAKINTMLQKFCELCLCRFTTRGYGATAARLTPDQKVGSLNLSGLKEVREEKAHGMSQTVGGERKADKWGRPQRR